MIKEILSSQDEITNFEISTSAEIHYTGKENISGFASLVNIFLRSMLVTSKSPCIINIDNVDGSFKSNRMEDGQVFYQATLKFKDEFTMLLQKKMKNLKSITVKTNFQSMPDGNLISQKSANKLCSNAFAYVGLKRVVYV